MKKLSLIGLFITLLVNTLFAQVPQAINYQAIARDNAGLEIVSTAITVRFSIGGAGVSNSSFDYQETHTTSTNAFGLFNVRMGQGTPTGPAISAINWTSQRFLLVEVNFGSGFEQMGVAQPFVSVPYAVLAQDVVTKELPATATNNDILTWNGSAWVAQSPGSVSETTTTLVDNGNGTFTYTNELGAPVTFDANIDDADANATNEIQDLQLTGNILTITNNGSATPVDLSIYNELPATAVTGQVLTWNGTTWIAQNSSSGADNWGSQTVVTNGTLTGDGTAGNPLSGFDGQYSSLSGTPTIPTQTSQLTNNSGFITSEVDGSVTNEIQNVSISGNALNISGGTGTNISTNAPSTNQVLTWNGSAWVAQNAGSGADNWGSQVTVTDSTLTGNGTSGNPLVVARPLPNTAATGQTITWNGTAWVASNAAVVPVYNAGTGITVTGTSPTFTINNSAPDQTVALTGSGATTVSGTYPNFTVSSTDAQTLSRSGNAISISGGNSVNISTTAPTSNQVLTWNGTNWIAATPAAATTYTAGTGININGSNVISNTTPDQTVVLTSGSGISITGTYPNFTITNSSPNQVLTLSGAGGTTVSGTYPNLTVTSADAQTLSIGGNVISISNGNSITIPSIPTGTSGQTMRHDGTNWVANSNLYNDSSNVAVGTTSPGAKFHVYENNTGAGAQQFITNPANSINSSSALAFTNSVSSQGYMMGIDNTTGTFKISNSSSNLNAFNRIQIDPTGNVGIGNFVGVTSRLDVDGQITMRTGAVAGYVPVSNSAGTMTWTDPSTLITAGPWTKAGTNIYPTVISDYVGIGTTAPSTSLHIEGDESTTTTSAFSGAPKSAIRLHNSNLTNNNFSSLAFTTQLSNAANSEMSKIVGINVNHTIGSQQGDLAFMTRNSSNLNEVMRITGTGFVGIGITNPISKLDVVNSTSARTTQSANSFASATLEKFSYYGYTSGTGAANNYGAAFDAGGSTGTNYGVSGQALGSSGTKIGVHGAAAGTGTNWAGYFESGNVYIQNNVAIGSTTHNYSSSTSHVVSITETAGFPILEMNGYGVGTSSPATYVDHYKNDGTTNNHIVRLAAGTFGAHNTGFYDISVANAGSMTRILTMNQGKVGVGTNSYSNLNDIFNVYENDGAVDGENGANINVQNASGAYTSATTGEMAGIRFKVGSYVPNGMNKAGMFYQRNATYGRGDLIFAINNSANVDNVNLTDEIFRISNTINTNAVAAVKATTASAGSFINETTAGGRGITASASLNNAASASPRYGVYATGWYGTSTNYGVYGYGFGGTTSYGIYGISSGATTNWAGYFQGNVNVTGTLSKGGGTFKIDHPLDPENKILYHSFVESPDMMNIYNGNIITDANGQAIVTMPDYFDALNKDFRYQLTVIGSFAQAIIFEKMNNNQFVIKTDQPNIEVSWQVTGVRKDPWAEKNRVVPEVEKKDEEKGKYIHPLEYGVPAEKGIDYEQTKRD